MRHLSIFFALLLICCSTFFSFGQEAKKPNILILIADDWSYGHAGVYGDRVVRTPNIDAIGKTGAVFHHAFAAAPSCTPSRAAMLTGRFPHELEAGANLWGYLPEKFDNYTLILEAAGYHVGLTGKGWGPGNFKAGGYEYNPAGRPYKDFAMFMDDKPAGKPFSFWFGSQNPHRPYDTGSGEASGLNAREVAVPGWLPDTPEVRKDILDYYREVEQFDQQVGELIKLLKERGEYENTLIIVTSDNGMPFPRAKATLYDAGTRIPLIISMQGRIQQREIGEFVSLTDIAPTILELSGEKIPDKMSGSSLWPLLRKEKVSGRNMVFTERERHANVRMGELGYPARAIRTDNFLYIRNYAPERWPSGDPDLYHSVGPYGDVDASPSKEQIMTQREQSHIEPFFNLAFFKRPADELYDLRADPYQKNNVAYVGKYRKELLRLKKQLDQWQFATGDPRLNSNDTAFDSYPYFGPPVPEAPSTYKP